MARRRAEASRSDDDAYIRRSSRLHYLQAPRRMFGRAATTKLCAALLLFLTQAAFGKVRPGECAAAAAACKSPANAIVAENCQNGTASSEWDVNGAGDPTIQGFATRISIQPGEAIAFKVDTDASQYDIDIYRLGYYGGLGARHVARVAPSAALPQRQPSCKRDSATRLVDCGNWAVSGSWHAPAEAVSGLYIARLTRAEPPRTWRHDDSQAAPGAWIPGTKAPAPEPMDVNETINPARRVHSAHAYGAQGRGRLRNALRRPRASLIYFVVRINDEDGADLLFQTSDTTWNAYNTYGGTSMYGGLGSAWDAPEPMRRSYKASYNRPLVTRSVRAINAPLGAEYPLIRFLERNGFDVSYASGARLAPRRLDLLSSTPAPNAPKRGGLIFSHISSPADPLLRSFWQGWTCICAARPSSGGTGPSYPSAMMSTGRAHSVQQWRRREIRACTSRSSLATKYSGGYGLPAANLPTPRHPRLLRKQRCLLAAVHAGRHVNEGDAYAYERARALARPGSLMSPPATLMKPPLMLAGAMGGERVHPYRGHGCGDRCADHGVLQGDACCEEARPDRYRVDRHMARRPLAQPPRP